MELRCECCGGNSFTFLGSLGNLDWFRCRSCGFETPYEMSADISDAVVYDADAAEYTTSVDR